VAQFASRRNGLSRLSREWHATPYQRILNPGAARALGFAGSRAA
jgi:hypothetical protein